VNNVRHLEMRVTAFNPLADKSAHMSNKFLPDRRQKKTQAALQGAFRDLLLAEGYESITIGSVTALADVGRSTFYEHYRTKDDLLRASIYGPFTVLAALVDAAPADLSGLLRHFREHQQVARVLLGWPTRPVLASALADLINVSDDLARWCPLQRVRGRHPHNHSRKA